MTSGQRVEEGGLRIKDGAGGSEEERWRWGGGVMAWAKGGGEGGFDIYGGFSCLIRTCWED